jgi:hypothetical protein
MAYLPRKKSFIYKRAVFLGPVGTETLQSLLAKALGNFPFPKDREEKPDPADDQLRWINYSAKKGRKEGGDAMQVCEFICCTKGAHQGGIEFASGVAHYTVNEVPPPVGNEYLEGAVYFGALGNHVVIVQSKALRTRELEQHLNWFLRNKAGVLAENNQVALDDNIPPETIDLRDAKGLDLFAPVHFQAVGGERPMTGEEIVELKKERKKASKRGDTAVSNESARLIPVGRAWEAVTALLGDAFNLPSHMKAEDMLKSGNMRVKLSLLWQNMPGQDAGDFVRDVAHKMRHVSPDDLGYAVRTKSGAVGKDTFKPQEDVTVSWGKVHPDPNSLYPKMLEWLEKLFKDGKITP